MRASLIARLLSDLGTPTPSTLLSHQEALIDNGMAAIETDPCEHSHTALLLCNFWMDSSGELLSVDDLGRAIPCACCLGLGAGMPPIGLGVAIGTAPFIPTSCFAAGACCGAPSSSSSCKGAVGGIPMPTSPPFRNGFRRAYPIITPRPPSPISNSFFFACHVWVNCSGHSAHSEPDNDDELHTHTQHPRRALGKRPPASRKPKGRPCRRMNEGI